MRVWNLDDVCPSDVSGTIVNIDTDEPIVEIFIPGPPGPSGSAGSYAVVSATGSIPSGQNFTIALPSAPITLTLPPISAVTSGQETGEFVVKNASQYLVTLIPSGDDEIEFGSSALIQGVPSGRPGNSLSLLPTSLGWLFT